MSEVIVANPNSADVLYTTAKEELKRFEVSGFRVVEHCWLHYCQMRS